MLFRALQIKKHIYDVLFYAPYEIIRLLPVGSPSHKTLGPLTSLAFKIGYPADFVEPPFNRSAIAAVLILRALQIKKHIYDVLFYLARPERFELPTPWFEARYSIQLSYGRVFNNSSAKTLYQATIHGVPTQPDIPVGRSAARSHASRKPRLTQLSYGRVFTITLKIYKNYTYKYSLDASSD
jgi:hypothetical protein